MESANDNSERVNTLQEHQAQIQDFVLLQRVAQKISSILELDDLLEQIVTDVAQTFGYTRSGVVLLDEAAGELVIAAVRGWTTNYHVKGDRFKIGYGLISQVFLTGETCYASDVSKNPYYEVSEASTRSEVDIPIKSRGSIIGVFNAQHCELDAFPPHRIQLLESLAGHVGVAIENARLFERERLEKERMVQELSEARAIQSRLFPERAPNVPGYRISGLSQPCLAVGGDWYDYIPLPSGQIAIVLGDVAGKGTGAAFLMASTRSVVRMHAEQNRSPREVISGVNRLLTADLPAAKFVTMIYAVLDPASRKLTYVNAGHLPPILFDSSGLHVVRNKPELPLGVREGTYPEYELELPPGSRLFLYSDGVVEARNPSSEEYGQNRLLRHVGTPSASADSLLGDVLAHASGYPLVDDVTIVMVDALPSTTGSS